MAKQRLTLKQLKQVRTGSKPVLPARKKFKVTSSGQRGITPGSSTMPEKDRSWKPSRMRMDPVSRSLRDLSQRPGPLEKPGPSELPKGAKPSRRKRLTHQDLLEYPGKIVNNRKLARLLSQRYFKDGFDD